MIQDALRDLRVAETEKQKGHTRPYHDLEAALSETLKIVQACRIGKHQKSKHTKGTICTWCWADMTHGARP